MNDDVGMWVKMLTGALGNLPNPEILSLEESCRTLQAQIESMQSHRDPEHQAVELEELEARVSALSGREALLRNECARLEQQLRSAFELSRTAALASHDALSQQKLISDADETVRRAGDYFGTKFSTMTLAQIKAARSGITRKLTTARRKVAERIVQAHGVLEQHAAVGERMQEREAELAVLIKEIEETEQELETHHHVRPDVFATLRNFTAEQLAAYRDEVIQTRLNDARHERARGLAQKSLLEIGQ
jgi:hypothetical protein